jgi:hypothetical protein
MDNESSMLNTANFCFLGLVESIDCEEQCFAPRNAIKANMILRSNQVISGDLILSLTQPHIFVAKVFFSLLLQPSVVQHIDDDVAEVALRLTQI